MQVSIDAASPGAYALNRGGDWTRLMENLEFIASLKPLHYIFSMVVQANNFREIPRFTEMAERLGAVVVLQRLGGYAADGTQYAARAVHELGHRETMARSSTSGVSGSRSYAR